MKIVIFSLLVIFLGFIAHANFSGDVSAQVRAFNEEGPLLGEQEQFIGS